ncbi:MAG: hypothetical protein KGZ30_01920 [Anaplasmataceae bacterium]|nr:hypothetical protein [Anaplasmataceae bacterium]
MRAFLTSFSLALSPLALFSAEIAELQEFKVDLKDPLFRQGVISTDQGGVITTEGIRIQARQIEYVNRIENGVAVRKITAQGDLLFQYGDQAFIGEKLEYDFITRTGLIEEGKTHVELWFIGGEKIYLQADGSYYILNAYFTSWTSDDPLWEVHAGRIRITEDRQLSARNLRFNIAKFPFFWLPSFKTNLNLIKKVPIRYAVRWDKELGPRISGRYLLYSWETLDVFLRGDYRLLKGGALALETEYLAEDRLTEFVTRSYGAIDDKSTPIEQALNHYRLQGKFRTQSHDDKTHVHLTYDKISDQAMIFEFPSDDFEINTGQRTNLLISHLEDNAFVDLQVQPLINRWQSLNQQIPSLSLGIRPFEFGSSGIIMQNFTNSSFLDYTYASNLRPYIHNTHSIRLQTINSIYRPLRMGYVTVTPSAGIIGIFYNNNPEHHSVGQATGTYGCTMVTRLQRPYTHFDHVIEPYMNFQGLSRPKASIDRVFIFSIKDGYHSINSLRFGVKNSLYRPSYMNPSPKLSTDLYSYAFFGERGNLSTLPRLYTDISLDYPSNMTDVGFVWNIQEHLIDRINARTRWTINEDVAFALEVRHRSRFDWRKADHENFIMDVSRPFSQLLQSPISDGRNTLLLQAQIRLHPLWTMHLASHAGWGRGDDPAYHSGKVDLYTTILTGWRIRLSATVTADDASFDAGIELIQH